jgi:hypothetical protein
MAGRCRCGQLLLGTICPDWDRHDEWIRRRDAADTDPAPVPKRPFDLMDLALELSKGEPSLYAPVPEHLKTTATEQNTATYSDVVAATVKLNALNPAPKCLPDEFYDLASGALGKRCDCDALPPSESPSAADIRAVCDELRDFLLAKNAAYGDSALDPVRILSRATPAESIRIRIDDKLSRLARGHEFAGDDTIKDLAGYFVLYLVALKRESLAKVGRVRDVAAQSTTEGAD